MRTPDRGCAVDSAGATAVGTAAIDVLDDGADDDAFVVVAAADGEMGFFCTVAASLLLVVVGVVVGAAGLGSETDTETAEASVAGTLEGAPADDGCDSAWDAALRAS